MDYYFRRTIPGRITGSQKTILIARSEPDLSAALERFGYTDTSYDEGYRLYEIVRDAEERRLRQLGLQVAATDAYNALYRTLRLTFDADRKIARLLLRDEPELYTTFRLHIRTVKSRTAFRIQAAHLYEQMRDYIDVIPQFSSRFNLTLPIIEERLADLDRLDALAQQQQRSIGETLIATEERRVALRALDRWMKDFISVARVAFRDQASRLRKLGILTQLT